MQTDTTENGLESLIMRHMTSANGLASGAAGVVRKHSQILPGGFVTEAMASFLAHDLGLPVRRLYRVRFSRDFAQTVPDIGLRAILEKSGGPNLGCAKTRPGYTIWPRDQSLPKAMRRTAMEIFVFAGLVRDPGRN